MQLPHKIDDFTLVRELDRDGLTISYHGILDSPAGQQAQIRRVLPHVTLNPEDYSTIRLRIGDLAHVSHPYLQSITRFSIIQEAFYIVESHREGLSLQHILQWCRAKKVVPPPKVYLYLLVQLCTALEALHATTGHETKTQYILHRALCPSAVYLTRSGQLHLGNYGLVDSPPSLQHAIGTQYELRNIEYLSPEQTHSEVQLTPASDIFSLASIAYELLLLKPLFRGNTQLQTIHRIRRAEVNLALSNIKSRLPGLDKVLFRAFSLNPRHRYQRAFVLREDIRALMAAYSFTNIKTEVQEFLAPIFEPAPTAAPLFPTGFGPEPEESDDTSAILRASATSDDEATVSEPLTTDLTGSLPKAPTAESFVFLRPSEPSYFHDDDPSLNTELEDTASGSAIRHTQTPEDAPFPQAMENTNPHLKEVLRADEDSTSWFDVSPGGSAPSFEHGSPLDTLETTTKRSVDTSPGLLEQTGPLRKPREAQNSGGHRNRHRFWIAAGSITGLAIASLVAIVVIGGAYALRSNALIEAPNKNNTPVEQSSGQGVEKVDAEPSQPEPETNNVEPQRTSRSNTKGQGSKNPRIKVQKPRLPPTGETAPTKPPIPEPSLTFSDQTTEPPLPEVSPPVEDMDMNTLERLALVGQLSKAQKERLTATSQSNEAFSSAYAILYSDAKARSATSEQRYLLESLMSVPENQRNPALLVERAQLAVHRKAYDAALKDANLAERHWARLPPKLIFSRKAMIFETQAASWQGKFYESRGEDLMSGHRAIQAWQRFEQHAEARNRKDMVEIGKSRIESIQNALNRLENP